MLTNIRRCAGIALACAGLFGCGDSVPTSGLPEGACSNPLSAPVLTLVDSVILAENDTLFLGSPAATFTLDVAGQYFIPDRGNNRVLQYSAAGAMVRTFGRQGSGPGEFRGLGNAVMVTMGRVWQDDYARKRINLFDTSGSFVEAVPYQGRLSGLKAAGSSAWAGLLDASRSLGVAEIDANNPADSLAASMVSLPLAYSRFPMLSYWDHTSVLVTGDTLVIAFGGVEYLVRYQRSGTPIDTVWVPTCRRQGSPEEIVAQAFGSMPRNAEEQARVAEMQLKISGLMGSWRLSDGRILVWYQDPSQDSSGVFLSRAFLSVLSPDLQRACVDAQVYGPGSGKAVLAVHNDQVHLLDQVVLHRESKSVVQTVIRKYSIDTDQCRWLGTSAPRSPPGMR